MSKIDLLIDEENELVFQLNVEGNAPGTAKCRLKLENKGMDLLFEANSHEQGEVSVVLPPLSHVIKEGDYDMTLEVLVDDKYFEPLKLTGNFEKSVKVTAEAVVRKPKRKLTSVSASLQKEGTSSPITVRNSKTTAKKVVTESPEVKKKKQYTDKDILALIAELGKRK
jgi:hypothetical protein